MSMNGSRTDGRLAPDAGGVVQAEWDPPGALVVQSAL
jgi:hypothetical protein